MPFIIWLCSRTMRLQLRPKIDPWTPCSLQWLNGWSIRLDHGGSWVQIPSWEFSYYLLTFNFYPVISCCFSTFQSHCDIYCIFASLSIILYITTSLFISLSIYIYITTSLFISHTFTLIDNSSKSQIKFFSLWCKIYQLKLIQELIVLSKCII